MKLFGVYTALITPFDDNGEVDYNKLEELVEFQILNKVNGLVPVGTTGECPTLSHEEHIKIIECVIKKTNKRVPVIAGTGSNNTLEAIELTKKAKELGADACLIVNPYYNRPTQDGLYQHISKIAEIGLPIILYNIPSRCGISLLPETIAKLYNDFEEVIAIKEASGNINFINEILSLCDIKILSGDDALTLPIMSLGGSGVISVLSNLEPNLMLNITNSILFNDYKNAQKNHKELLKLFKIMFIESNPQPIKNAMKILDKCNNAKVRLPLTNMKLENYNKLKEVLKEYF